MSKTPRTDEHILHHANGNWHPSAFVLASFTRQLETELAEARAEIERLRQELRDNSTLAARQIVPAEMLVDDLTAEIERKDKLIEQMREALELMLEGAMHDFHYACQHRDNCLCWGCQKARIKAALAAAERGEGL